jgi:Protein of unknown function (DUF3553)
MESSMSETQYAYGDRVRHVRRPEWGIGTIVKVEDAALNGHRDWRLSIRFPNAGTKTLISSQAELEQVHGNVEPYVNGQERSVAAWDKLSEGGWLNSVAERKVKEQMISLPPEVKDPFNSLAKRLVLTMALYRFDRSGRGLIDWAVAQSGLDDPLSRFTRHDLEQHFDRWAIERDNHLSRLLQDTRNEPVALNPLLKAAPPAAADAVRRFTATR